MSYFLKDSPPQSAGNLSGKDFGLFLIRSQTPRQAAGFALIVPFKLLAGLVVAIWMTGATLLWAQGPADQNCDKMIELLQTQHNRLNDDLRRIQREVAALRSQIEQPGLKDVMAGVGYIFGLFGTGAYVAARRRN